MQPSTVSSRDLFPIQDLNDPMKARCYVQSLDMAKVRIPYFVARAGHKIYLNKVVDDHDVVELARLLYVLRATTDL